MLITDRVGVSLGSLWGSMLSDSYDRPVTNNSIRAKSEWVESPFSLDDQ
jgi:hypothetical protein